MDKIIFILFVTIIFIFLIIFFAIFEAYENEQKTWNEFAKSNNCEKSEVVKGQSNTGIGYGLTSNGQFGMVVIPSSTPDQTKWVCDDGVTYWR